MTLIEHLDNYAKRSLAHQLTWRVATQPCCRDLVREIRYERTDRPTNKGYFPSLDTGIITFDTGMSMRISDTHNTTHGYGLRLVDIDPNGDIYNYGHRNYYRHARRDLTDAQWREYVTARIASDYKHLYTPHNLTTAERN